MPDVPDGAPQIVLGFDFGRVRIGVACGDTLSRAASPLRAIAASGGVPRWQDIDALVKEWQPARAVVGLPYNADGTNSTMTSAARGFAEQLGQRYSLPIALVDERYSSMEAASRLQSARASGVRKHRVAKTDVDAAAACVILERWFNEAH